MTALVNLSAILLFAFLLFVVVAVALRLLIPSEPYRPAEPEHPGPGALRRALTDLVGALAVLALVLLAVEVQYAYGAPFGERASITVEVVEVGACERAPIGYGITRTCQVTSYRYTAPEQGPTPWSDSIEVVVGEPVQPGDRVAFYSPTDDAGWIDLVLLGTAGSRWQPVSAEERPNLVWLPAAMLIATTALAMAIRKRIAERAPVKKACASF